MILSVSPPPGCLFQPWASSRRRQELTRKVNPDNPAGYKVGSVAFSDGQPVDRLSSRSALSDVMTNPTLDNCPDECFRPVGLAWDGEGRLWVTSDSTGEIYVLRKASGDEEGFVTEGGAERIRVGAGGLVAILAGLMLVWA